jgi:IS5 family transposase
MIRANFEEAFTPEWIRVNIIDLNHELVILRQIIPWEKIVSRLTHFYNNGQGAVGKSLRIMAALVIISRFYKLSDRAIVKQVKENRYIQYFCNVADEGLLTFVHYSSMCVFRKRIGEEGVKIIEQEIFKMLRDSGIIKSEDALIDSTVLASAIIYPNDVELIYKAFKKMSSFAKLNKIPIWWDDKQLKKQRREFSLDKKGNRGVWLLKFNDLFIPALEIFQTKVDSLIPPGRRKNKALKMLNLLNILEEQTVEKLSGEIHIKDRIVSLDDPDARPIKKGKSHPDCEFGTKVQMSFNRQGFMITVENFIGNPCDKILYPGTFNLYINRTKRCPDTVITDLGARSQSNFEKTPEGVSHVFLGRSTDVVENKRDVCHSARSATEGFIAAAKNLRGFGKSLWHTLKGHRMWSLVCQTAYNLKKFLQLYYEEEIEEKSLLKLGLA